MNVEPHKAYNAGGKQALINGISGNNKRYGDKEWLGFSGDDVEITIDFENPTEINSISTRFYNGNGQWIYAPKEVTLFFKLNDGRTILSKTKIETNNNLVKTIIISTKEMIPKNIKVDYVKITILNYGVIPDGKQGAGHKAWTFIDEIIVQ